MNADKIKIAYPRSSAFVRGPITALRVNFAVKRNLAPVPVYQNPAVPVVNPAMRYPAGTRLWTLLPPSLIPGVSVAIPTLVPGNPHMVTAGSPPTLLDVNTGWSDANHNIGRCGAEGQRGCKNQSHQSFKNHTTISFSPYTVMPYYYPKRFSAPQPGVSGERVGRIFNLPTVHVEGRMSLDGILEYSLTAY
jgi:hypothetical protein